VAELKAIFERARVRRRDGMRTLVFVDEIIASTARSRRVPAGGGGRHDYPHWRDDGEFLRSK